MKQTHEGQLIKIFTDCLTILFTSAEKDKLLCNNTVTELRLTLKNNLTRDMIVCSLRGSLHKGRKQARITNCLSESIHSVISVKHFTVSLSVQFHCKSALQESL